MKKNLTVKETILVSSMLFGMFFGAGNLIFPATLGISSGSNIGSAFAGLFVTAVGLPLLAVAALATTRTSGVMELSSRINKRYAIFFSTLLYLTIGPLFAVPRCASTSFAVGAVKLIGNADEKIALAIFSLVFFIIVLIFALKPGKIMTYIGKILTPTFLAVLAILIITGLFNPIDKISSLKPSESYVTSGLAFFKGFIEGYNTVDALAGLAFGIIVVNVVKSNGVESADDVASNTAKAGIFSCLFMGIIYLAISVVCAQSSSICVGLDNGGAILGTIADYYFGSVGSILMTAIVTLACLKTALGLVTSCSQAFTEMFPKGPSYKGWAIIFCIVAYGIANFGLSSIVTYCVPILMFIYPLAMVLILLALFEKRFNKSHYVYTWTISLTLISAVYDFVSSLTSTLKASGINSTYILDVVTNIGSKVIPFASIGLSWICPSIIGFIIGLVLHLTKEKSK